MLVTQRLLHSIVSVSGYDQHWANVFLHNLRRCARVDVFLVSVLHRWDGVNRGHPKQQPVRCRQPCDSNRLSARATNLRENPLSWKEKVKEKREEGEDGSETNGHILSGSWLGIVLSFPSLRTQTKMFGSSTKGGELAAGDAA